MVKADGCLPQYDEQADTAPTEARKFYADNEAALTIAVVFAKAHHVRVLGRASVAAMRSKNWLSLEQF